MAGVVLNWSSNDPGVASISQQGLVTAVGNGTAVITARTGNASATANVTVSQEAVSIVIEPDSATLMSVGETVQLAATVLDGNGQPVADAVVAWRSSDEAVATVSDQGLVTAVRKGAARITASSGSAISGIELNVMIPEPDRGFLIAFYHATGGPDWTNRTNWLSEKHIDEWFGVNTDVEGRVTDLNLGSNGLKGPLPPELVQLTRLQGLSLENNRLSGSIVPELGRLSALTHLYLFGNLLTGSIPPELGQLENLIHLCLNGNNLTGSIPPELSRLRNLRWLHLHDNADLAGRIPTSLATLALDALLLQGTRVCLHDDPDLKNWASGITDVRIADCAGFDPERSALEALYLAANGPSWNKATNWLSDAPLADWFGVETDGNGRVSGLRLESNGLSGSIPPDLAQLTGLTRLNLGFNELTGQIPAELGLLGNLESLQLDSNRLNGSIPVELGKLANLEVLRLSLNLLIGNIPAELGRMSNLREMYLDFNRLTGSIPAELGQLENLTLLWLRSNRLVGEVPEELGQLSNLGELRIGINKLTGDIPAELGRLKSLKALELDGNELTGEIPAELGKLSNLTQLVLSANQLSGSIPAELGQLSSLSDLFLSYNDLTGDIPAELGQLTNLSRLTLYRNRLTGHIPSELGQLSRLLSLHLYNNRLTGPLPAELGKLSNLESLLLNNNASLAGPLPYELLSLSLQDLGLSGTKLCVPVDDEYQAWLMDIQNTSGVRHCDSFLVTQDKDFLVTLYHATDGPNWENNENWLSDRPLDEWFGVTTNFAGRVAQLSLENNNLTGTLPLGLAKLTDLKTLRFSGNTQLTGSLPRELTELLIDTLQLEGTLLCAPPVAAFQTWLERVTQKNGVVNCETEISTRTRRALAELYYMTNGQNWRNKTNWLSDAPFDSWYGVSTDPEGRVTALRLETNNLVGTLPAELGELTHLFTLSLIDNRLSGNIPVEISRLTNLTSLQLGYNQLSGRIPVEIGVLSMLHFLDLTDNQLTGSIPKELGQLTRLNRLRLGENQLTGDIPAELGDLPELHILSLYKNQLEGDIPPELGQLGNLLDLGLHDNRLEGSIPAELARLGRLRGMYLSGNMLSGSIPGQLGRLSSLVDLELSNNNLSGKLPSELGDLTNLKSLGLSFNRDLFGPIPDSLTQLELNTLFLDNTQLCAPDDTAFEIWYQNVVHRSKITGCQLSMSPDVYLTQAVQSFNRPVPLVEEEAALLRVFFETDGAVLSRPPIRASFYLDDDLVHEVVVPADPVKIPFEIDEGSLEQSANATVPASVVKPGLQLVVEMGTEGARNPDFGNDSRVPDTGKVNLDVRRVPDFNLTLIPMLWTENPDHEIVSIAEELSPNDDLFRLIRDLLPVNQFQLDIHDPIYTSTEPVLNNNARLLAEIEALRVVEGVPGYYMGVLNRISGFGVATQGGFSSVSALLDYTVAHEVGHNMSLGHAPCGPAGNPDRLFPNDDGTIGAWGYDHTSGELIHPASPDIMSYCFYNPWISDYHFKKAIDYRTRQEETVLYSASSMRSKGLLVWGGLDGSGDLTLEPAFVVDVPPALQRNAGTYRLTGEHSDGSMLFSLDFAMSEIADGNGGGMFAFVLPVSQDWSEGLARITLSGPEGFEEMTRDGGRSAALLLDRFTGKVRGILRDWPESGTTMRGTRRILPEPGLDVMVSPGIPATAHW